MENLPKASEKLTTLVFGLQTKVIQLETENQVLKGENQQLKQEIQKLQLQLFKKKSSPPFHPKANSEPEQADKQPRRIRVQSYTRKRSAPTHRVFHAPSHCDYCGVQISGQSVAWTREIIDLPVINPTVTEHVVFKRGCWNCGQTTIPAVDLSGLAVGQSRIGINLMSAIITLKERFRLPIRMIRQYLKIFCRLDLSIGEIVLLLRRTAGAGQPAYQQLQARLRASPTVHGDETGWRENGRNGYIWSFNTPTIRYFCYRKSRGSQVVREVLGEEFEGVLVTDFYSSYNVHDGFHQRCWAHLLRDLKNLVNWFPHIPELACLSAKINALFEEGKRHQAGELSLKQRHQRRRQLEEKILHLVTPYLSRKHHPFHTLAARIDRFLDELFIFVLDKNIPATNNSAERALRHSVIARKISGGTRSKSGSRTKEILSSLFGTWEARGLNPLEECRRLLVNPNYAVTKFNQEV